MIHPGHMFVVLSVVYGILCYRSMNLLMKERSQRVKGMPEIRFYLSDYQYMMDKYGLMLFVPPFSFLALIEKYSNPACYSLFNHRVKINLSTVAQWNRKGKNYKDFKYESLEDYILFSLEHESIHSAINSSRHEWMNQFAQENRKEFMEMSHWEKFKKYCLSGLKTVKAHANGHSLINEEWAVENLQRKTGRYQESDTDAQ